MTLVMLKSKTQDNKRQGKLYSNKNKSLVHQVSSTILPLRSVPIHSIELWMACRELREHKESVKPIANSNSRFFSAL